MTKLLYTDSMAVGTGFSRWDSNCLDWDSGEIATPQGFVSAYMQGGDDHESITRLDFIHNGRLHIWTYGKRYSKRGVVTLAKRMAKTIADQQPSR